MSRYDGLIIPRSYSEYINKTDAATLQQALQLSGVLSGTVAAGDNKAVRSSAVNEAIKGIHKQIGEFHYQASSTIRYFKISGYQNVINSNSATMAIISIFVRYTHAIKLYTIGYPTAPNNCIRAVTECSNLPNNMLLEIKYDISTGLFNIYVKITPANYALGIIFELENRTQTGDNITVTEATETEYNNAAYSVTIN